MSERTVNNPAGPLAQAATICLRLLIVGFTVLATVVLLGRLPLLVVPVLAALLLASVLAPPVRWLERHHWKRGWAAITVLVALLLVVVGALWWIFPQAVRELQQHGPSVANRLDSMLATVRGWLPADTTGDKEGLFARLGSFLRERSGEIVSALTSGLSALVKLVVGILLTVVLLFFFLRDGRQMADWAFSRLPRSRRDDVRASAESAYDTLHRWMLATALIALVDATFIGLGLFIIGVPLVLPLALLIFIGGFIPVVGATVSGGLAVLVALASGGTTDALLTLGVVLLVQQLEGNVLQPVIMGHKVPLHPVVVLLAVTAGGLIAGILGAFVAVPLAAMASAGGHELRRRYLLRHGRPAEA